MGVLKIIGLIFLGLFILFVIMLAASVILMTMMETPHGEFNGPVRVSLLAAGIRYNGPTTTALAAYYCIYNAVVANDGWLVNGTTYAPSPGAWATPGYSVQLNTLLSNGYWVQEAYGGSYELNYNGFTASMNVITAVNVWHNGELLKIIDGPVAQPCGWLIISIRGDTAYFGYSSDNNHIIWFGNYTVGNAVIVNGSYTNLVIAGPGEGAGVNFTNVYAVLALFYWNETGWAPAPVSISGSNPGTGEFVTNAWVYTSGNEAIVTWPEPSNRTIPIPTPQFKP